MRLELFNRVQVEDTNFAPSYNLRWFFIQLVTLLFAIVLAIVVPILYVLRSVASYRRARQRRAMLSLSELLSTSLPSHCCPCVLATGHLSAVFDLLRTPSSVRSSSNSSAIWQEERIPLGGFG